MAFDAHIEDFQRMGLRQALAVDEQDPFGAMRSMANFRRRFAQNRDSLPQSDDDRAFYLVARATDVIDYQLPFADDSGAERLIGEGRKLLLEACELSDGCHDARRMLAAADNPSFEDYYRFLADGAEDVRRSCEQRAAALDLPEGDALMLGRHLALAPYERWLAALSARALECGHYRRCLDAGERLLALDGDDPADVRLTMALAYAKLEDKEGLDALMQAHPDARRHRNPWYGLANLALAFKARDFDAAGQELSKLLAAHPGSGTTMARQDWLPAGVYARIVVRPGSEDELILAVSEATVILQEGCDPNERGTLGSWAASQPAVVKGAGREGASGRTGGDAAMGNGVAGGAPGFGSGWASGGAGGGAAGGPGGGKPSDNAGGNSSPDDPNFDGGVS